MSAATGLGPYARVRYGESVRQSILNVGDSGARSSPEFLLWGLSAAQLRELAAQCISVADRLEAEGGAQ